MNHDNQKKLNGDRLASKVKGYWFIDLWNIVEVTERVENNGTTNHTFNESL
jgi:hypothetical protein